MVRVGPGRLDVTPLAAALGIRRPGPILIAEVGGNHEGSFDAAVRLCDLALAADVDVVKFQLYRADHLVNPEVDPDRHAHFRRFELTRAQHIELAERCGRAGVAYLASVWDVEMLDWIDDHVNAYKVGSGDLTARPIVRELARRGKPIILSTGLATLDEVEAAVRDVRVANAVYREDGMITLLQCTSVYPMDDAEANLRTLPTLASLPGVAVGYSDHTTGMTALKAAAVLGATALEFHFTDAREGRGFRDHQVSLTAEEVGELREWCGSTSRLLGTDRKEPTPGERSTGHRTSFRRALYPVRPLTAGHVLRAADLGALRPAVGIGAEHIDDVIGRSLLAPVRRLQPLSWDLLG